MSNVLSFPVQPEDDKEENKAVMLKLLDNVRAMVEKGDLSYLMILGRGPEYDAHITWAGHLNHIATQGLLAVAMRDVQQDMLKGE
jgi:hypothetical protein